jgi:cell division protein FtsA
MQELFEFVQKEIMKSGCHDMLPAGLVLSGGGSQLHGVSDTAAEILDMPVRLGKPGNLAGLGDAVNSPIYSTAVGLVQYGAHQMIHGPGSGSSASPFGGMGKAISGFFSRLRAH